MKIISKYKDYYDYLTGIYGIDELAVYDRTKHQLNMLEPDFNSLDPIRYDIAICNQIYVVYLYKNNFYHTVDELIELDKLLIQNNKNTITWIKKSVINNIVHKHYENRFKSENKKTNINKKLRQPILISIYSRYNMEKHIDWSNCILQDFKFAKYIKPEDIFKQISEFLLWLNDNPEIPNNQTNTEKILAHGFDLKSSFRNKK